MLFKYLNKAKCRLVFALDAQSYFTTLLYFLFDDVALASFGSADVLDYHAAVDKKVRK